MTLSTFAFKAVGSAMTLYGATYVLALARPRLFYDFFGWDSFGWDSDRKKGVRAAFSYMIVVLRILSIGTFFYHAAYGIVGIVPSYWMVRDEDGSIDYSVRQELQVLLAALTTTYVMAAADGTNAEGKRLSDEHFKEHGY